MQVLYFLLPLSEPNRPFLLLPLLLSSCEFENEKRHDTPKFVQDLLFHDTVSALSAVDLIQQLRDLASGYKDAHEELRQALSKLEPQAPNLLHQKPEATPPAPEVPDDKLTKLRNVLKEIRTVT